MENHKTAIAKVLSKAKHRYIDCANRSKCAAVSTVVTAIKNESPDLSMCSFHVDPSGVIVQVYTDHLHQTVVYHISGAKAAILHDVIVSLHQLREEAEPKHIEPPKSSLKQEPPPKRVKFSMFDYLYVCMYTYLLSHRCSTRGH